MGIVSSMVFLAQFILSLTMGSIIEFTGETVTVETREVRTTSFLVV